MRKAHVIFMAGGTGGHIFPALALAQKFQAEDFEVSWLGTKGNMEERIVPQHHIAMDYIPIKNLRGKGLLRWLFIPFRLAYAVAVAVRILKKRGACLVVGMGGFASGPGALAAKLLGIPIIIHEQNAIAGLTNRYLAKIATKVFTGFPKAFPLKIKAQYVGNPLRQALIALHNAPLSPPHQPLRVLVVGGSLGAQIFNTTLPKALALLPPHSIELWQQSGEKHYEATLEAFKPLHQSIKITAFIEDMAEAYTWADLVICRAGALTISELSLAKKPAILIPLPHAADDHQRHNARFLSEAGAAVLLLQKDFTPEHLSDVLKNFIQAPQELQKMASISGQLALCDAAEKIFKSCASIPSLNAL